ncbi:MAG: phospho-sugar mutase [Bacteroidetes bacterium]|nr:phospho-sugar mutase [Bacteroidota bacterium]
MTPDEKARLWLNSNIDPEAKDEILRMLDTPDNPELEESFYKDLEFGTGGLRGIMGIGSNRMNKFTVGMATQGLANYLHAVFPDQDISVAIAYDSRNNSPYFADITASVFSANDIRVYFFTELRPTPELSFALRHFNCQSGVVITASHNPKEYNGYKAYWDDGAQVTPPHDVNIIDEVRKISGIDEINFKKNKTYIQRIGVEIDDLYLTEVKKLSLNPDVIARQKNLKIIFSPLHGTGITLVPRILKELGFNNVHVIKEQAEPDGNFPTVIYPNPEEAEALSLALTKAQELDADLIMATDPDADRVGIAVKNNHGDFQLLNGNQTASLLIHYLISQWKAHGKIDGRQYIVKTIVTSELMDAIAAEHGVECFNTLTGFKYIAIILRELEGKKEFIGGGEESYGFMISDFVRDKDAVSACAMIAEMTAYAQDHGKSLFDMMIDMYVTYGFYLERLISVTKKGISGEEEIARMMKSLRENPPAEVNGSKLVAVRDYASSEEKDLVAGNVKKLDFPASNVLQFFTADGSKISARPSGTEPKIKFYFSVKDTLRSPDKFDAMQAALNSRIDNIIRDMGLN